MKKNVRCTARKWSRSISRMECPCGMGISLGWEERSEIASVLMHPFAEQFRIIGHAFGAKHGANILKIAADHRVSRINGNSTRCAVGVPALVWRRPPCVHRLQRKA